MRTPVAYAPGSPVRAGYTLLEVICAMAIAVVLLAALYVAMHVQYDNVQAGRDIVEQSTLAHVVMDRMSNDLSRTLGPQSPATLLTASSSGGGSASGGGTSGASGTTGSTTAATGTTTSSSTATTIPSYNLGLQGDEDSVTVYVTTGRRDLTAFSSNVTGNSSQTPTDANGQSAVLSDIHRITYKIIHSGEGERTGLMRQDVVLTTGIDNTGAVQDDPNEDSVPFVTVASEVEELRFQYLDPQQGWVQQWPDQATGYDPTTPAPFGPPMAIEIRMTIVSGTYKKNYRHVVPILSADGTPQQASSGSQSGSSSNSTTNSNGQ